ncbi:hypothetical protein QQF64_026032 [Cirrhinus molitorella]|uniref:Uncharacterized protein n=1 Tax=Cirrhinus molitorella TaxID=172907 RepID=A0ABR3NQQ5_9TELE
MSDLTLAKVVEIVLKGTHAFSLIESCVSWSFEAKFEVGDAVLARDYRGRERWASGVVTAQSGPVSYTVDVGASEEWRCYTDQLLSIPTKTAESQFTELPENKKVSVPLQTSVNATSPTPPTREQDVNSDISAECQAKQDKPDIPPTQVRRYPARVIKPPNHLTL